MLSKLLRGSMKINYPMMITVMKIYNSVMIISMTSRPSMSRCGGSKSMVSLTRFGLSRNSYTFLVVGGQDAVTDSLSTVLSIGLISAAKE